MWLARKHTRAACSEIGRYFGRRSHSTVISAQKKVTSWMTAGRSLELANRAWGVEEAIQRVEAQLRVG
jgi:chromosomal replication initiator protein